MSIIQRVTPAALPIETRNIFSANFNVPTPGEYDFGVAANANQVCVRGLNQSSVYLIDRVSFSASIGEETYLLSVNQTNLPEFTLTWASTRQRIYGRSFPAINYKDNLAWSFWFWSDKQDDDLLITFDGSLFQVAETVGTETIHTYVSLVLYQTTNEEIIRAVRSGTSPRAGRFYNMGAGAC